LEHGGDRVSVELARSGGEVLLVVADDGSGIGDGEDGTGMSIVRALVRDELGGSLALVDRDGLRTEVRFPAYRPRTLPPPRLFSPLLRGAPLVRRGLGPAHRAADPGLRTHGLDARDG